MADRRFASFSQVEYLLVRVDEQAHRVKLSLHGHEVIDKMEHNAGENPCVGASRPNSASPFPAALFVFPVSFPAAFYSYLLQSLHHCLNMCINFFCASDKLSQRCISPPNFSEALWRPEYGKHMIEGTFHRTRENFSAFFSPEPEFRRFDPFFFLSPSQALLDTRSELHCGRTSAKLNPTCADVVR